MKCTKSGLSTVAQTIDMPAAFPGIPPDTATLAQDITIPATSTINFAYHSSVHNLYVGSSPCAYTTEICPAKDAASISASSPCKYTPGKAGLLALTLQLHASHLLNIFWSYTMFQVVFA